MSSKCFEIDLHQPLDIDLVFVIALGLCIAGKE
jgi:hypothetical protein